MCYIVLDCIGCCCIEIGVEVEVDVGGIEDGEDGGSGNENCDLLGVVAVGGGGGGG